jgi:tRNA(Ile)-lysidine synthetase-like protein
LDQRLVEDFCLLRRIPLFIFKKKLGKGSGIEERSRAWRRQCYARAAAEAGARFVFLAHHAQDQAETLLLNLARGAGAKGAMAMLPLSPLEGSKARLARPFLGLLPADLKAALKKRGLGWREDISNADLKFARNSVRHRVLPELEKLLPGATLHLAAFTRRVKGAGLPGMDAAATQRIAELIAKGRGSVDLKGGAALEASKGVLRLKPSLKVERRRPGREWRPEANAFWFSDVRLEKQLKLRHAAKGDRIRPFGMKGSKLVFDILAEEGVPAWKRESWPLIFHRKTGEILGILGLRQAEGYRIGPDNKEALRVSWPSFDRP